LGVNQLAAKTKFGGICLHAQHRYLRLFQQ